MRILFVHQNFPAQYKHLAPALAARGHEVLALAAQNAQTPTAIRTLRYKFDAPEPDRSVFHYATDMARRLQRAEITAAAARHLRDQMKFTPDVICGHIGWGETFFLKEVWPDAKLILYAEFFYATRGRDVDFDPEFQKLEFPTRMNVVARTAGLLLALASADRIVAPTAWQAGTFPAGFRERIEVIHDGIDTVALAPAPDAAADLGGAIPVLRAGEEILTFVNRQLEPYRGFHIFMRALPKILAARPNARVVIVGGEGAAYGQRPPDGRSWKEVMLSEVGDRLDLQRVHFTGLIPYAKFADLMRVSRVHAYLTYPFVLSWSMLEAMSAGALVVGSRTPPVEEVIEHGVNGLLADFFDVEGWSRTLIEALASPGKYQALRHAARRAVTEKYDLAGVCLPAMLELVERA